MQDGLRCSSPDRAITRGETEVAKRWKGCRLELFVRAVDDANQMLNSLFRVDI
jgi:hypothetical protein